MSFFHASQRDALNQSLAELFLHLYIWTSKRIDVHNTTYNYKRLMR